MSIICIINFRFFLCIDSALAILRTEGNCPIKKYILKVYNCWEISFFSSFKIFTEMLFGSGDLCKSIEDIMKDISFLSVEVKKKVFMFVLGR